MNLTFTASISDSRSFKAHLNQAGLRINEWHKALWFSPFVHGQEKLFQDLLASFRSAFDNLFLCIINPEFRAESALMSSVLQTHKLVGLRSIWETRSCWEWLHLCINLSGVLLHDSCKTIGSITLNKETRCYQYDAVHTHRSLSKLPSSQSEPVALIMFTIFRWGAFELYGPK